MRRREGDETVIRDKIMHVSGIALSVSISVIESFTCLRVIPSRCVCVCF